MATPKYQTAATIGDLQYAGCLMGLGQMWGLMECWTGEIEPPMCEMFKGGRGSRMARLTREQMARLVNILESFPDDYILSAVIQAHETAQALSMDMLEDVPGVNWPGFFYCLLHHLSKTHPKSFELYMYLRGAGLPDPTDYIHSRRGNYEKPRPRPTEES